MFFLSGGKQIVGQAGGLGNNCNTDEDCDSGFCNEEDFCAEPEPTYQPSVENQIASVTIS